MIELDDNYIVDILTGEINITEAINEFVQTYPHQISLTLNRAKLEKLIQICTIVCGEGSPHTPSEESYYEWSLYYPRLVWLDTLEQADMLVGFRHPDQAMLVKLSMED